MGLTNTEKSMTTEEQSARAGAGNLRQAAQKALEAMDDELNWRRLPKSEMGKRAEVLRAALAAAPAAAPAWQPIETAPKDGLPVLVIVADATQPQAMVSHWAVETWRCGLREDWDAGTRAPEYYGYVDGATHWMPLPAAPGFPCAATAPEAPQP